MLALAPLLFFLFPSAESEVDPEVELPTEREEALVDRLVRVLKKGQFGDARSLYEDTLSGSERITDIHYERVLAALQEGQLQTHSKSGLLLYGEILANIARQRADVANFAYHSRRLRHQSMTLDARQSLYSQTGSRLMEYHGLADFAPDLLPDILDYCIIFGGQKSNENRRPYWSYAIELLPRLLDKERRDPSQRFEARYHPLRTLARTAAASGDPKAFEMFERVLGSLGDGSPQSVTEFRQWFADAIPGREPRFQGNADPSEYYGYDSEVASSLRNWSVGIYRFYLPGEGLNRGSSRIRLAVRGLDFGAHSLFRLDLAEALRDEANRLETSLHDASLVAGNDRIRELHDVGWGALRLGYVEDVQEIIERLTEHTISSEVVTIRGLFEGALAALEGDIDAGFDQIDLRLQENFDILEPAAIEGWRQAAVRRTLPSAEPEEAGQIVMELGLLWDDMREMNRLEQALTRLRGEQARRRDRYYLRYLEAIVRYRKSDVEGLSEQLLELLDQEEPPGVSRAEVAGLAFAVDRRIEDVVRIDERRREVTEELVPMIIRSVPDRSSEGLLARSLDWQVRMDASRGDYLDTDTGRDQLESVKRQLDTSGNLAFSLEERWLALKEELLDLTHRHRDRGDTTRASEVLELTSELIKNRPRYYHERAQIFELQAAAVPAYEEEDLLEAWSLAADAYQRAATTEFGNPELLYDAAIAYSQAEQWSPALDAMKQYDANRATPLVGEFRYWGKKIEMMKIYRHLGFPAKAVEVFEDVTDLYGARAHLSKLRYEKARALEQLERWDDALATYERILSEMLDSFSQDYITALHLRSRILQARKSESETADGADPAQQERAEAIAKAARLSWIELAAKLRTLSADARLAEALYSLGVDAVGREAYDEAQSFFDRLARAEGAVDLEKLPSEARDAWLRYGTVGALVHADSYQLDGEFSNAVVRYRAAIERLGSPNDWAWAFLMQGYSHARLNEKDEAQRVYQLGRRRVSELTAKEIQELRKSPQFWIEQFDQALLRLEGS